MKNIEINITNIMIVFLIFISFLLRPTALGQNYTTLALVMILPAFLLYIIRIKSYKNFFIFNSRIIVISIFILLFWSYEATIAILNNSSGLEYFIKAMISNTVIFFSFVIFLNDHNINYLYFKNFIRVLLFTIVSYYITLFITLFINWDSLYLFKLHIKGYLGSGGVYFPFTVLYGFMHTGTIILPRLMGLFREPGIFQAFLIWAFFSSELFDLNNIKVKILIILGIIATFSTAGIGIFLLTISVSYILNNDKIKKIFGFLFMIVTIYLLFNIPFIGIYSKLITHSDSILDRLTMLLRGIIMLSNNPFGIGMYNDLNVRNAGINLLASSYMFGIIGVLLVVAIFLISCYFLKGYNKKIYVLSMLPIILTMLFSQPLVDAPLIYILLLANYSRNIE